MAVQGWEGARRKRRERARKANREDVLHAGEHMLGGGCKAERGMHAAAPAKRIGEDRTRWAAREQGYRTEGAGWMDECAESACEFVCPFRRERLPARIDSALSFGY